MSEQDEERQEAEALRLPPEAERARAALRAAPPLRADPAFRERLKQEFVSGAIEVTGSRVRRLRANGESGPSRLAGAPRLKRGEFPGGHRRGVPTLAWVVASLAAAAALVVVFGSLNRGPTWWVTAARGDGTVRVDGQTVALDDRDAMRRLLVPGAEIELTGNAELDICSNGVLAVQLAPGTRMTLPPPPGRWLGRRTELYARSGELRVTTGKNFPGAQLAVMSPTAAVEIKGTTVAIIIEDTGTCVCVYEGSAMVGRLRGGEFADMHAVPGGMRRYVYKDERAAVKDPDLHDMRAEERGKLASFRDSQRPWLMGEGTAD
ncbi:MAG TPA: hypothetical protein VFM00_06855 [Candidatus Eisenbacteria bacterium]|nr:hypothetical protein [Candidatus Eisenbacteria bacterium]